MRVVIELKRGEIAEIVQNNLFKLTQLQDSFGMNMVALVDGQPRLLGEHAISIASVEQRGEEVHAVEGRAWVPVAIITDRVQEHVMDAALAALAALPDVVGAIVRMRVEEFTHD
jgi:DNA gyrase subunit A